MFRTIRFAASALLLAGVAYAGPTFAADPPHGGGGMGGHAMPSHGFRGAPPGFHGTLPHGGPSRNGAAMHHEFGRAGHDLGVFRGHDFGHFTPEERTAWEHGGWRHTWHHGHYGWWWGVGDFWFFYPGPIYPYPDYIGPEDYYDYYDQYGAPAYYWYHCGDPAGYYPYVQQCNVPWEPVPPAADGP